MLFLFLSKLFCLLFFLQNSFSAYMEKCTEYTTVECTEKMYRTELLAFSISMKTFRILVKHHTIATVVSIELPRNSNC